MVGTHEIGVEWRKHAVSPFPWRPAPHQAGALLGPIIDGEGGGIYVTSDVVKRRAYLKPKRIARGPFRNRAAREKIASDLAHDLGVSVPPVMLYRRDGTSDETLCCVSLVMTQTQFSWEIIKQFLVGSSEELCKPILAAMPLAAAHALAFNSWVMQFDHNDHPHNIVFAYDEDDSTQGRFILLDYAYALGHSWGTTQTARGWKSWETERGWVAGADIPIPPHMERHLLRGDIDAILSKIEAMPDDTIAEIVQRIPDDFMLKSERDLVQQGLIERRAILRELLDARIKAAR